MWFKRAVSSTQIDVPAGKSIPEISRDDMNVIYDAAWDAVDESVKERAIEVLRDAFDDSALAEVRRGVEQHGRHAWTSKPPFTPEVDLDDEFYLPMSWHHSVGMSVRNLLRQAGLTDDKLPKAAMNAYYGAGMDIQNWDDYYVQAMEAAAGAR